MKNQNKIIVGLIVMVACLTFLVGGCTVPVVTEQPDGTASTNHIVDPKLATALAAARASNAATAPINPYSPLLEIGLGLAAAGAGWYAKRKNDAAAANALLTKTIIQAIDTLDDSKIKDAIQVHAVKVGVEGELNQTVKQVGSGLL